MSPPKSEAPRDVQFDEIVRRETSIREHLRIEDLRKVRLTLTADLGQCSMMVRDVLELKRGSVVALDKLAGEMSDINVNGIPVAKGEVVVIADVLHVRIGEIIGVNDNNEMQQE